MSVMARTCLWLVAAGLVAGCASSRVVSRSGGGSDRGPVAVSTPKPGVTTTVKRGQNLYRIATDNGITQRDLAAWNGVQPPYTIHPGERLTLSTCGRSTASSSEPSVVGNGWCSTCRSRASPYQYNKHTSKNTIMNEEHNDE